MLPCSDVLNAALFGCITGADGRIRQLKGISANARRAYAIRPTMFPKIRN
jgi:hypothetical protein